MPEIRVEDLRADGRGVLIVLELTAEEARAIAQRQTVLTGAIVKALHEAGVRAGVSIRRGGA